MQFEVEFKNLGQLKHAQIRCRDVTVFAGVNSTGKSYASRALYSIFAALAIDPERRYYSRIINDCYGKLDRHSITFLRLREAQLLDAAAEGKFNSLLAQVEILRRDIGRQGNPAELIKKIIARGEVLLKDLTDAQSKVEPEESAVGKGKKSAANNGSKRKMKDDYVEEMAAIMKTTLTDINGTLKELKKSVSITRSQIEKDAYIYEIKENFIHNFQVKSLAELVGDGSADQASIKITSSDYRISFAIERSGEVSNLKLSIIKPDSIQPPFYLESPIYWKLEKGLFRLRYPGDFGYRRNSNRLLNVPKYFYDADELLYSDKIELAKSKSYEKVINLISQEIGGKIIWDDEEKRLVFVRHESGATENAGISLQLTATGIVQLGMIGYFLEADDLGPGTILFIDEPEAHLHPFWQEKMMRVLYALKDCGIKVVLATHSPIVLQRLKLRVEKYEEEDSVWLNRFELGGEFDAAKDDFETSNKKVARAMNEAPYRMFLED